MMAPKIYHRWDKLKDKLLDVDKTDVEGKGIGKDHTLAIEFEKSDHDPRIKIISDLSILERWIEARNKGQPLILAPPSPPSPPPPPPAPTNKDSPNKSPINKPRKPIVKIRPKQVPIRSDESSKHSAQKYKEPSKHNSHKADEPLKHNSLKGDEPTKHNSHKADEPLKHNSLKGDEPTKHYANKSDEPSASISSSGPVSNSQEKEKEFNNDPSPLSPALSESSKQPTSASDAICRGTVDRLVIIEPMDDDDFRFDDDDLETDTQLHKTLKKIRSDPVPQKEQASIPSNVRLPPPLVSLTTSAPPPPAKSVAAAPQPPVESIPKTPPKKKEPDWNETAKQLQTNQFHNVYKDLVYFKDRIHSDNKAKSLVREAVIKCVQEDETNPLSDLLILIYSLDFYKDDKDFWSELLLRLKRKIQPNSLYKTKSCPNTVRANYRRVLDGILDYAASANLKLTLNFNDIVYFVTHSTQHSQSALASSKVEPDVKPEVKQDRQENVDPSIVRRVTLIKDAHGKPSFKIVRPLNVSASRQLKRIKM